VCGPNQQQVELRFRNGTWFTEVDCAGGSCGLTESQLYHLLASGLFEAVAIRTADGRTNYFSGARAARFVADFEEKREARVRLTVNHELPQLDALKAAIEELKTSKGETTVKPVRR
jgi:hypothetical protein